MCEWDFDDLIEQFYGLVQGFFRRKGVPEEDGLDLTQETFLCIYRGRKGFRGQSSLKTWVFAIALNSFLQYLRHRKRGVELLFETIEENAFEEGDRVPVARPHQFHELKDKEQKSQLAKAIGHLPQKMRECLILRLHHDLKYQEIADFMDININTVKAHLNQARERLRKDLGDRFDFEQEP